MQVNWNQLVESIQNYTKSLNLNNQFELRERKIEVINGLGFFRDAQNVTVLIPNKPDKVLRFQFISGIP